MLYSPDDDPYSENAPAETNAGNYAVWYKVEGYNKIYSGTHHTKSAPEICDCYLKCMIPRNMISDITASQLQDIYPNSAITYRNTLFSNGSAGTYRISNLISAELRLRGNQ